jgi:pyruvate dehydrogenase E1 component alpha subunit/2-oxoisovalerate dehydrogenase E1 component alpha subunit
VGGLFRSLGQEADAVGSCFALERRDVMSPLIRNLGAMLVKGATPVEVLKQYMAKGDSPTRGRELNIHFGDVGDPETTRGFLGQISPLGDMVPVMAGVTLSFRLRGQDRVGLVYVGDGATSTGAFHEGINLAAVQRCPLVVVVENNGYAYSTPTHKQTLARRFVDKAVGYGVAGARADGNDVLAVYDVTKEAVDRARARREVDEATDVAEASPFPEPLDCLAGVYADPPAARPLWYRDGVQAAVERNERPEGWGTYQTAAAAQPEAKVAGGND